MIDETHDPQLKSWVSAANTPGTDFPIQNLPFGRYRKKENEPWQIGVAIGDQVLDLRATGLISHSDMSLLLAMPPADRRELRKTISRGLRTGSPVQSEWQSALHPAAQVQLGVPCEIGDYTDFYVGIHHAMAVGKLFRPDNPLLPNYKWVPIGYHGRSSTVISSGEAFRRPKGQIMAPGSQAPVLQPTNRLDFELELGVVIGQGNPIGEPVPIEKADDHVFGLTLFNDWSARDVQAWEYQPLGPFLAKNFASTISPWVVTLEALAPFRTPFTRPSTDPQPLPYLSSQANSSEGAFDIELEVLLQTQKMRDEGLDAQCISRSNFAQAAYWTVAQMVTHHTVGGCALKPGDLFGSGTLSGAKPEQAGSMLELSSGGKQPITLANGETRVFLQDGDTVTLYGYCNRPGAARIGFGLCSATILPSP